MEIKLSPSLFPAAQLQQTSFAYDTDSERFKTDKPSLSHSLQDEPPSPISLFLFAFSRSIFPFRKFSKLEKISWRDFYQRREIDGNYQEEVKRDRSKPKRSCCCCCCFLLVIGRFDCFHVERGRKGEGRSGVLCNILA